MSWEILEAVDDQYLTPKEYEATLKSGVVEVDEDTPGKSYGGGWGSWGGKWAKSKWNFDSIEDKIQRQKDIQKAFSKFKTDNAIIAKTYINSDTSIERKSGIYSLSINNTENWSKDMVLIKTGLDVWKRLPSSQRVKTHTSLISGLVNYFAQGKLDKLFYNTQLAADNNWAEIDRLTKLVHNTLRKPIISDSDVETMVNAIPEKIKKDIEELQGHGGISPLAVNWQNVSKINKPLRITPPTNRYVKFPHISRGKRINKGFIQKTDYRALRTKEKIKVKKKKLLVILDASGSMSREPYTYGVNFISELVKLDMFDVETYHTTDSRVTNATIAMKNYTTGKSNNRFLATEDSEGFELLTMRLNSLSRDEDYVLVITDMLVPDDAEQNLKSFIGGKKHLILSFKEKGKFGCNVRLVKKYEDMMNVVTTLLR